MHGQKQPIVPPPLWIHQSKAGALNGIDTLTLFKAFQGAKTPVEIIICLMENQKLLVTVS